MTDTELSEAWARMMGWHTVSIGLSWFDEANNFVRRVRDWNPITSWSDWGLCYEWMEEQGYALEIFEHKWPKYKVSCCWRKPERFGSSVSTNLRRAMLLAALKAEGVLEE